MRDLITSLLLSDKRLYCVAPHTLDLSSLTGINSLQAIIHSQAALKPVIWDLLYANRVL